MSEYKGVHLSNAIKNSILPSSNTDLIYLISEGTMTETTLTSYLSSLDSKILNNTNSISSLQSTVTSHLDNKENPHTVTKEQVGLSNVDNTSDIDKPISNATQVELNKRANITYVDESIKNYQPTLVKLDNTSGEITLDINKIYTCSISDTTTFILPSAINHSLFNQIKVMLSIVGTPTINWGTNVYFNKKVPEIVEGSYDVYYDYDEIKGVWVLGIITKGTVE